MNILYVEDEPNDARLVERYVRSTQHEITIATNIETARAALSTDPTLILVDLLIDEARLGLSFVKELRSQGYEYPIIAVTALSLPTDVESCMKAGCNDVITKPYTLPVLAEAIDRYSS